MNQVAITSDVDWAPEPVIEYMLNILELHEIKCTFFCTHSSNALLTANPDFFELAIHPNFNPLLMGEAGNAKEIIEKLMAIFPDAKGVRSHSMLQSTPLLNYFYEAGLKYESNYFLPYQCNVNPHRLWNGMISLPYIWEDDMHWMYGNKFNDLKVNFAIEGLKILDFHPVHVYLNTIDGDHYQRAKQFYHDSKELARLRNRNKNIPGALDALMSFISQVKSLGINFVKMNELTDQFESTNSR